MTSVKICGLKRLDDALVAVEAGADLLGFVFAPSRRRIEPAVAREVIASIRRRSRVKVVGVFVNAPPAEMNRLARSCGLDYVQLSGDELDAMAAQLDVPAIQVIHVRDDITREDLSRRIGESCAELVMLDAAHAGAYGGSGATFDWSRVPTALERPLMLAGGLHAGNVSDAIRAVRPWGVDVSSGVESEGEKDQLKIRAFVRAVRAHDGKMMQTTSREEEKPVKPHYIVESPNPAASVPTAPKGRFGPFGGQYVPETLMAALGELEEAYAACRHDPHFQDRLEALQREYVGRPTPLFYARNLSRRYGAEIYLKREDLAHTGAHKINGALGQGLLAERMGKRRIIAETGAGQHGVATATVCAMLGLQCVVYMGAVDVERQALNVFRMDLLGAEVRTVSGGTATLKDAINEAFRDWVSSVATSYYLIGSVVGPHPYPLMVRDFQSVIGREARRQMTPPPDYVVACVGGGSNAMGIFHPFSQDESVRLIGVEAGGRSSPALGEHAATLVYGVKGVLHGARTYVLQDEHGQIAGTHSVSAGLDYPGVGPEHSMYKDTGRAQYVAVGDAEALEAFQELSRTEGIIPALEPAHALAYALRLAQGEARGKRILVNLSGRGDKDVMQVRDLLRRE